MSDTLVIDASVALKWVVNEAGSSAANALLDRAVTGTILLVAPEHLLGEVGNGLRKRVAQGVLSGDDALRAMDAMLALDMEFVSGAARWARTLADALRWSVTTYDALYIAIAVDLDAELITADLRLLASGQTFGLPVRELDEDPTVPATQRPPGEITQQ